MLLQEKYNKEIVPVLMSKLGIKNRLLVPRLKKVVVNCSTSEAVQTPKVLETIAAEFALITGQKPVITRAKKSIAAFKIRAGQPIGVSVTLRRGRMYEFFNRLVSIALPRTRDFKGLPKRGFDGHGNYTFGIEEQIIFPEISPEKIEKNRGMNVTFVTSAKTDGDATHLLTAMGFPLRG